MNNEDSFDGLTCRLNTLGALRSWHRQMHAWCATTILLLQVLPPGAPLPFSAKNFNLPALRLTAPQQPEKFGALKLCPPGERGTRSDSVYIALVVLLSTETAYGYLFLTADFVRKCFRRSIVLRSIRASVPDEKKEAVVGGARALLPTCDFVRTDGDLLLTRM